LKPIGEHQVKTGGYGAEFGRSLGGVISVNTKRGTNDFHGGISASYAPENGKALPSIPRRMPAVIGI
jgi:outer membrane receptor protein involved in Fe transport